MFVKQSGITLLAVLFVLTAALILTATVFFSFWVDALSASNGSAGDDALYTAEAGIHHLWSVLEPAPDFARELAWPDGEPPFGAVVGFPAPPHTYRVRVSPLSGGRLSVKSEGTSHRGTRRKVEAVFARESGFRPPAALTIAAGTVPSDLSGALDVSASEAERDTPALAVEDRRDADALLAARHQAIDVAVVGPSGLETVTTPLGASADVPLAGMQDGGTWGSAASPALVRLDAVDLSGTAQATGVVIANGPLRVLGHLEVDGLLLAPSGIAVEGTLVIRGAAFFGGDLRLAASGSLSVDYSPASLDLAESAGHGLLPKAPLLGAWREVW